MLVAIRVDSSIHIGIGHVMRCLTLASELRDRNVDVHFICRDLKGNISATIEKEGFQISLLPMQAKVTEPEHLLDDWEQDAVETITAIGSINIEWCVVDHYGIDYNWHAMVRGIANNIFVIDDMPNRIYDCDILLDQTYRREHEDYKSYTPNECVLLMGTEYALLRNEFRKLRTMAMLRRRNNCDVKKIFISLGGMDSENISSIVLGGIELVDWNKKPVIDVILNVNAPHLYTIEQQARRSSFEINILTNVKNIAQLMLDADLAIGAGGTTSWERCCLGLPSLVITTANNQKDIIANLEQLGAIKSIGYCDGIDVRDVSNGILDITSVHSDYLKMSEVAFKVCSGKGVNLCVNKMLSN